MTRMYLHRRSGDRFIKDLEGTEFTTLEDAVELALESARAALSEPMSSGSAAPGWRVEIANARGELLAVVPWQTTSSAEARLFAGAARWYRVDAI